MKIIKTFDFRFTPLKYLNLEISKMFLVPSQDTIFGEIETPELHPTLATKWLGIQVQPNIDCQISLCKNNQFFYFDAIANQWKVTPTRIFQDISVVLAGISFWSGPVKFTVRVPQGQMIQQIIVGYEVNANLVSYILQFALPELLRSPITISEMTQIDLDGSVIIPPGIDISNYQELSICPLEGRPIKVVKANNKFMPESILVPQPVQLIYTVPLTVDYAISDRLFQIEKIPSVIIRKLERESISRTYWSDQVFTSSQESVEDINSYNYDLPVSVTVFSSKDLESDEIADLLIRRIQEHGRLHVHPFDIDVGLQAIGGAKKAESTQAIAPILFSSQFKILVKRL